jgi:hypothetical protein
LFVALAACGGTAAKADGTGSDGGGADDVAPQGCDAFVDTAVMCGDGAATLLARDPSKNPELHWLDVDDQHVYWIEFRSRALRRIPKRGGVVETVATLGPQAIGNPAVLVDDGVMWAGDGVYLQPKTGGSQRRLFALEGPETGIGWPIALAGDATSAFAIINVVKPEDPGLIALESATAAKPRVPAFRELAVDATSVYFLQADGGLVKQAKGGGPVVKLASGVPLNSWVALDTEHVYLAGEEVLSIPKTGGPPVILAGPYPSAVRDTIDCPQPYDLAVDETAVYWTQGRTIRAVSKNGGTAVILARVSRMALRIAVDRERVYWIEDLRYIRSIEKPRSCAGRGGC